MVGLMRGIAVCCLRQIGGTAPRARFNVALEEKRTARLSPRRLRALRLYYPDLDLSSLGDAHTELPAGIYRG
jgi:hypothetical protein